MRRRRAAGRDTLIYEFKNIDGAVPYAPLLPDGDGTFYGTTSAGGGTENAGIVFKLSKGGGEQILHKFGAGKDGRTPYAGLIPDAQNNLYGTTYDGGVHGGGTVFNNGSDGSHPYSTLAADASGNLYGTTLGGGTGFGTVFKRPN